MYYQSVPFPSLVNFLQLRNPNFALRSRDILTLRSSLAPESNLWSNLSTSSRGRLSNMSRLTPKELLSIRSATNTKENRWPFYRELRKEKILTQSDVLDMCTGLFVLWSINIKFQISVFFFIHITQFSQLHTLNNENIKDILNNKTGNVWKKLILMYWDIWQIFPSRNRKKIRENPQSYPVSRSLIKPRYLKNRFQQ
jgi:hypothetical protein